MIKEKPVCPHCGKYLTRYGNDWKCLWCGREFYDTNDELKKVIVSGKKRITIWNPVSDEWRMA